MQPIDFYHSCPIAYSLGNLGFDGATTVASWNRGALLEVGLNEDANFTSIFNSRSSWRRVSSFGSHWE